MNSCLDIITLARYIGRTLSDKEKDEMERHLSECRSCREEFAMASVLLKDDAAEKRPAPMEQLQSVFQTIKKKASQFYEWITVLPYEAGFQPAFVRSGEKAISPQIRFRKDVSDLRTEFLIEKTNERAISIEIGIFKNSIGAKNIRITLLKEGGGVVSRLLKGDHELFENLPFGVYRVNLIQNSEEKGNVCFEIDETGLTER
jgi:hypothetical protein